jgi:hypothetical protein
VRNNYFIKDNKLLEKVLALFLLSIALVDEGEKRPTNYKLSEEQKMKAQSVKITFATIALLLIAAGHNVLNAQEKAEFGTLNQSPNRIVGAWETTVTPRNCDTGEQIAPSFNGVITFNEGGTVAEFGANPTVPYRTPGHGIWINNGGGSSYSMKFSFLPLTPAGAPVGRMRVTQDLELGRFSDESTSTGSFVLTNLAGAVIATGCSSAVAVRLAF